MNPSSIKILLGCLAVQAFFHTISYAGGFVGPAAGAKKYARFAPTEVKNVRQLNQPLGQKRADAIARKLGLDKSKCFTPSQFRTFVAGKGVGGNLQSALLIDDCVAILTNSKANPLIRTIDGKPMSIVLGSYGLYVNTGGMLESPANSTAPTRKVNPLIIPGGYIDKWCQANGATESVVMLYKSAFTIQSVYGGKAQANASVAELFPYRKEGRRLIVGASVVPPLWEVNFCLIYMLNPKLAARMPAHFAAIPNPVVAALEASPTGQVPYSDYASYFGQ